MVSPGKIIMKKINLNINKRTNMITTLALFSALSITLSILESIIPTANILPPGAKLGLSNIITMFICGTFGLLPALIIATVKSFFVLSLRGPTAFLMSFFGGICSICMIWVLTKKPKKQLSFIFISIVGAISHNLVQLLVSSFLIGKSIFFYIPVLILAAVFTGSITGTLLKVISPALSKVPYSLN
ncbi:MAG: hypothetical protein RUMPE_00392 [Eubacteriales bacterium SKADARSKE-1]|nr:hypothetical protein [Eubacteriales bacterium SKADARSKE-1]